MERIKLNHHDIMTAAARVAFEIGEAGHERKCYPVPRGGIPAAYALGLFIHIEIVEDPKDADFFMDDIIDSGSTRESYSGFNKPFYALVDKESPNKVFFVNGWIVFPWEGDASGGIENNVTRILQFVGEDVEREGLKETPARVAKAYKTWFSGYGKKAEEVFKTFKDGGESYDEMVVVKNIPFYSHCEHHMAPFFGTVTIAYIPNKKIVGLSKLGRLVDIYSRRFQVQERLTNQIVDAIEKNLNPIGVACIVKARHLCMESRGIEKQGHSTVTSAMRGAFKDKPAARAEFMQLAKD